MGLYLVIIHSLEKNANNELLLGSLLVYLNESVVPHTLVSAGLEVLLNLVDTENM